MKIQYITLACAIAMLCTSCIKNSPAPQPAQLSAAEGTVLTDFASVVVNPSYVSLQTKAGAMSTAVDAFIASPTDANLATIRSAWKDTRAAWESCEGFLFGPVEDFNYDPTMDSWPVNKIDLDALITSDNKLTVSDVDALDETLKGFHAIEYIIFGVGSTQKAANITAREKLYLSSLAKSLYNTTTELRNSWDPSQSNNFTAQFVNAGTGSAKFSSRFDAFNAWVGAMADICDEVANSKMQNPFAAQDSTLDESSFSHNSLTDFKNNIIGVRNAYLCQFGGTSGHSLSALVAAKNAALDNKIQAQINAAIASFGTITVTYEKAIYTQKNQIKNVQAAINTLHDTIDGDLATFVQNNIKD